MGRETGSLQLLASLLLTGGKGADLVIRGNVVLNRGVVVRTRGTEGDARPGSCSCVHVRGWSVKFGKFLVPFIRFFRSFLDFSGYTENETET
jgi:hypothetical protein